MVYIYRKSNRKLLKTIPLCILTLAVFWISTRPELHRHGLPIESSCSSWPIKWINNNHFTLLPVLVLRLRKFNKRIIAPLHHSQTTWNKHGYLCLSPPDLSFVSSARPLQCDGSDSLTSSQILHNDRSKSWIVALVNCFRISLHFFLCCVVLKTLREGNSVNPSPLC